MVTRRYVGLAAMMMLVALGGRATLADAHPLHTTLTELVEDRSRGIVRATVRAFADDFGTAVTRAARGRTGRTTDVASEQAAVAYATSVFALQDSRGHALALRSCGVRRAAEVVWVCLEASVAEPATSLRVRNAMLWELYEDQVNVVQSTFGGARRSLLFVRGDRFKPLG